jgi:hypothetical protein
MANTYKWTINALDAKISQDGNDNVVYTIHWGYTASDDSDPVNTASSIGTYGVEYDADNFTPYADLTEANVISWLEAGLDVDSMKSNLDSQIELKVNPVDVTFSAPFAASSEE